MERLPAELLISIGKYTQDDWRPMETLHSLTLCSRRLHAVYQSLLYSHIMPGWSIHCLRLIIRFWNSPTLASKVRHVRFIWVGCDDSPCDGFDADEVVDFVDEALDEIFDPEEEESRAKWREHLLVPCEEAWWGLALVRLTRLETIEFGQLYSELMSDILRKAARRQRPFHQRAPFPHLREALVEIYEGYSWVESDFLTPFFYFPAVRRISGGAIGESMPSRSGPMFLDASNPSCPVREITITEAWWCCGMLDWLAASTQLEHISIALSVHPDDLKSPNDSDSDKFKAPEFRIALLPFTRTLKTLRIQAHCQSGFGYSSNIADDAGPFGSLKDFAVLEKLRIRHAHIGRQSMPGSGCVADESLVDILPSSLRSLEIVEIRDDRYFDLVADLSHLVKCRASFPQLAQIILYMEEGFYMDEEYRKVLIPVMQESRSAGVAFEVDGNVDGNTLEWLP